MARANPSKGFPFSAKKSMSKVVHKKPANMQCPKAKPKMQGLAQSPPKSQSSSSALVRTKEQEEQDLRFWARLHHSQAQEEYEQGGQGSMYQVQSTPKTASPMYKAQPKGKLKVQPKRKPKVPPTSHFGPQPKPPGAGIYVAQALAKTQGAGVNPNKRWRAGALCPIVNPPALSPPPPKSQTSAVLAQGMRITENAPRKLCSMVVPQHVLLRARTFGFGPRRGGQATSFATWEPTSRSICSGCSSRTRIRTATRIRFRSPHRIGTWEPNSRSKCSGFGNRRYCRSISSNRDRAGE